MALKLHNTLSRKEEEFVPLNPPKVTLYTCGPTVYNFPHIGNYRAYIFADILRRTLEYSGYDVAHVMNLTDIDDKTIAGSQKENKTLKEFTEFYTQEFFKDRDALNILPAKKYTKATDYIPEMVSIIEQLERKGFAYKEDDGSVYFNIKKDPGYGKLSRVKIGELEENASGRIKKDEYEKENAQDFALWKAWDAADGEVFWETSLGKGRPGWHIECSAMSMSNLGETIDIHTGGRDNIFPHHENEIAQSECATGKPFVNFWLHNEWLLVEGKKMAKSAGNFYTLRDIMEKGISPVAYRLWLLMAHYRTPANFNWDALKGAEIALKRLYTLYLALGNTSGTPSPSYVALFNKYIENDLDTPRALTVLWDVLKDETIPPADRRATALSFDTVLGLGFESLEELELPEDIKNLAEERDQARKEKKWAQSDELRKKIEESGYEVKDTSGGQEVRPKL